MSTGILVSGGVDSFIGWHYLGHPDPVYVDVGNQAHDSEDKVVKSLYGSIKKVEMLFLGQFEKLDFDIPGRNLYLSMVMANLGYDDIFLIVQKDETSIPDRKREFFIASSKFLSEIYERRITIGTPFWDMDKHEMVAWYLAQQLPVEELYKTWACYQPVFDFDKGMFVHCGNCGACFRRFVAFMLNGLIEPWYKTVVSSPTCAEYYKRCQDGKYSLERCEKTLLAISKAKLMFEG